VTSPDSHTLDPPGHVADATAAKLEPSPLERRGRRWIFGSFAFCPCHLPLTLGILATVSGGTAAGAVLRDHAWLAGAVITAAWVAGTWRGFRLVRRAQQGACPLPAPAPRPPTLHDPSPGPTDGLGMTATLKGEPMTGRSTR